VNAGNSGGALVNARGELVGINTAITSPTGNFSGYAFAVPVNIVHKVVENLKEFGSVRRAVLGISMSEITPEIAREMKLKDMEGIHVHEVFPGGAARKAGLQKGDIIKTINGIPVGTVPAFTGQLAKYDPGTSVTVSVLRDNKEKHFEVVLQDTLGDTDQLSGTNGEVLGAVVEPLSQAEQRLYRVNAGVKITSLKNGPLKAIGLQPGYVIVKVNSTPVHDREELQKAMKMAENDGVLITAISPRRRVEYFAFSLQN
jgi:S1-C subfamily serine protease